MTIRGGQPLVPSEQLEQKESRQARQVPSAANCGVMFCHSQWYRDLIAGHRGPLNRSSVVLWPYPTNPRPEGPAPGKYDLLTTQRTVITPSSLNTSPKCFPGTFRSTSASTSASNSTRPPAAAGCYATPTKRRWRCCWLPVWRGCSDGRFSQGGLRGRLIEVDRAQPRTAAFEVDVNAAT